MMLSHHREAWHATGYMAGVVPISLARKAETNVGIKNTQNEKNTNHSPYSGSADCP